MCIKCELKKAIGDLLGIEVKKEIVGKVDADLINKFSQAEKEKDRVKELIDAEMKVLALKNTPFEEAKTEIKGKYEADFITAAHALDVCMNEIAEAVGLDDLEGEFIIDVKTGEVFREVIEDLDIAAEPPTGPIH